MGHREEATVEGARAVTEEGGGFSNKPSVVTWVSSPLSSPHSRAGVARGAAFAPNAVALPMPASGGDAINVGEEGG